MRPSTALLIALLAAAGLAPFPPPPAAASCAGPHLEVAEGEALVRGQSLTVTGLHFVDGCQDAMTCRTGLGCDSCEHDDPPPTPYEDVVLELVQGNRSWELAVADADPEGSVAWTFSPPSDADSGPAELLVEHGEGVEIRLR